MSFSEDIDTISFSKNDITIFCDGDTLGIIVLYPSLSAAEIICLTGMQAAVEYKITGAVYDTAQNKGIIASSFNGSATPDTVTPYVVTYSKGYNKHEFELCFSEAMDTSFFSYQVIPSLSMAHEWQNLRFCRIAPYDPADSLVQGLTYYLYIDQGICDISGNVLQPFITSITPDTIYKPLLLKGEVRTDDTLIHDGVAVLERPDPLGIAFIHNGLFTFEVRDQEAFMIEAFCNGYHGSAMVWFDSVNVVTVMPSEKTIDSIIH
jgi:hypothetical protein